MIEFPNARGVVNYLHYHDYHDNQSLSLSCSAYLSKKSNTSLLKGQGRLGGGHRVSLKRLTNSITYERSSNVVEGIANLSAANTRIGLLFQTLNILDKIKIT